MSEKQALKKDSLFSAKIKVCPLDNEPPARSGIGGSRSFGKSAVMIIIVRIYFCVAGPGTSPEYE